MTEPPALVSRDRFRYSPPSMTRPVISVLLVFLSLSACSRLGAEPVKQWQTYAGYNPEGYGRHVVLISGDEEYRSEEALSQLGKILAVRHGFHCTVLYAQDPGEPGVINPRHLTHIPGLEALRTAELMIIATRFRALPDEQMEEIESYLLSGRPVIGLRTANHGFRFPEDSKWHHYSWRYEGPKEEWHQGFGGLVLGSWFFSHHGWHGKESTRGVIEPAAANHPILRGIEPGSVWGATDVYGVSEPIPGEDVTVVLRGEVLAGMEFDSPPVGPGPYEKAPDYIREGSNDKNDPMQALAWTKSYQLPGGRKGRAFCTTLGASQDLAAEGTRKLLVNAVYWCLDMAPVDPDVRIVDTFEPSPFKTHPLEYWTERRLLVSEFDLASPVHEPGGADQGEPPAPYFDVTGGRDDFGYDFAEHPVNRHRLYRFYRRQAASILAQGGAENGTLLPAFPGLDGGTYGHWGKFHKNSYRDRRWNLVDTGPVFAGILHAEGKTWPRAIAVRLDDGASCAFDPVTRRYTHVWQGDFVEWSSGRWGIGNGIRIKGKVIAKDIETGIPEHARFEGTRRRGDTSPVFVFSHEGETWTTSPAWIDGTFAARRDVERAEPAVQPAPTPVVTQGRVGDPIKGSPFAIDRIAVPHRNPYGSVMQLGGIDFFANGDAAICTLAGEVWRVTGLDSSLDRIEWIRVATGLNQALGLSIRDGMIYVVGRDRITRLHDTNGDGTFDFYENFCDDFPSSPGGHDFYTGLQHDEAGYFYFVAANTGVVRVSPDGRSAEVLANGLRNTNGIGVSPGGRVVTSTNEGDWTPASAILEVREGDFFGRRARQDGKPIAPAMAYIPRGLDNSSGGQLFVDSNGWGPLRDKLLHFSFGAGTWMMVLEDEDGGSGRTQGAIVALPGDFESGAHRAAFAPHDGQLYVVGSDGWGNYAITDGSLARVRFLADRPVHLPVAWKAYRNGILLTFAQPVSGPSADRFFCQAWNYEYGDHYGSPEYSVTRPGVVGHDAVKVHDTHLVDGGRSVFLSIPTLRPSMQFHLFGTLDDAETGETFEVNLFPTLLRLDEDFRAPGEDIRLSDAGAESELTLPVRWSHPFTPKVPSGKPGRVVEIHAISGLRYNVTEVRARPGEQLTLRLRNLDTIPHNWVLIERDSLASVGDAANRMVADPDAPKTHFVPQMDAVLHASPMLYHNQRFQHNFTAPETPGVYPYICTFPGHWAVMQGTLVIEE